MTELFSATVGDREVGPDVRPALIDEMLDLHDKMGEQVKQLDEQVKQLDAQRVEIDRQVAELVDAQQRLMAAVSELT